MRTLTLNLVILPKDLASEKDVVILVTPLEVVTWRLVKLLVWLCIRDSTNPALNRSTNPSPRVPSDIVCHPFEFTVTFE
jgi:hypothetical protein